MAFRLPRLYAIIDPAQAGNRSTLSICELLLEAGVRLIQYRDKRGSSRELFEASRQIAGKARETGAVFIVNDRADIARAADARGVHLGQEDLPVELARLLLGADRLIGASTHTLAQVGEADHSSADYIAFGPVFPTLTKADLDPVVGPEGVRAARQLTRKPLVAIGGITVENARAVVEAGADAVAVVGDLIRAQDIQARVGAFFEVLGARD